MDLSIPVPWGFIAAKTLGSPKSFPVLCLHGWQDNLNTFDAIIPFLPKGSYMLFLSFLLERFMHTLVLSIHQCMSSQMMLTSKGNTFRSQSLRNSIYCQESTTA